VTGRGSQWLKIRTQIKNAHPFCALCGTRDGLQVHHIAPFRLSFDNSAGNLIPLCVKHHKVVETITHDIEATGSIPADMTLVLGSMLREHQMATAYRIGVRND
jgi:predicted restriction endonuclease